VLSSHFFVSWVGTIHSLDLGPEREHSDNTVSWLPSGTSLKNPYRCPTQKLVQLLEICMVVVGWTCAFLNSREQSRIIPCLERISTDCCIKKIWTICQQIEISRTTSPHGNVLCKVRVNSGVWPKAQSHLYYCGEDPCQTRPSRVKRYQMHIPKVPPFRCEYIPYSWYLLCLQPRISETKGSSLYFAGKEWTYVGLNSILFPKCVDDGRCEALMSSAGICHLQIGHWRPHWGDAFGDNINLTKIRFDWHS